VKIEIEYSVPKIEVPGLYLNAGGHDLNDSGTSLSGLIITRMLPYYQVFSDNIHELELEIMLLMQY